MCGEKSYFQNLSLRAMGSPPHVRGKGDPRTKKNSVRRITPACAGKRAGSSGYYSTAGDHPRMCGEKAMSQAIAQAPTGSPPHVRGKVVVDAQDVAIFRITPACAGKSATAQIFRHLHWDHPRMCGEKLMFLGRVGGLTGITPACAGKRLKRSRSTVPHAAIVPLFPSVCNKPAGSDGSPAGHDAPPFLPIENAAPASPTYNLRSL